MSNTKFSASDMNEAAYSVNWRMVSGGEVFQFTLRDVDEASFVSRINALIASLKAAGWDFAASGAAAPLAQPQAYSGGAPSAPAGTPGTSNAPKMETIEGYVVGAYTDRAGKPQPVVLLYTPRRPYAAYRVYPERASLLPFPYPTEIEFIGGAPEKSVAMAKGMYHQHEFQLLVVPETNDDGTLKVNAKGYQQWRIPRVGELQEANPAPAGTGKAAAGRASTTVFPPRDKNQPHDEHALRWTMQTDVEAVQALQIPSPLDEWLIEVRELFAAVSDAKDVSRATDTQFAMLNDWAATRLKGVTVDDKVVLDGVGSVPLAGLLFGVLIDRYAMSPTEVPEDAAVALLRLIMEHRGTQDNPNYNQNFAENLAEVVRILYENVSANTPMAW